MVPPHPFGELAVRANVFRINPQPPLHGSPRISTRFARVVATRLSEFARSTRTMIPLWPFAATAMLPPRRNASPPNIFISLRSGSCANSSRGRGACSYGACLRRSSSADDGWDRPASVRCGPTSATRASHALVCRGLVSRMMRGPSSWSIHCLIRSRFRENDRKCHRMIESGPMAVARDSVFPLQIGVRSQQRAAVRRRSR